MKKLIRLLSPVALVALASCVGHSSQHGDFVMAQSLAMPASNWFLQSPSFSSAGPKTGSFRVAHLPVPIDPMSFGWGLARKRAGEEMKDTGVLKVTAFSGSSKKPLGYRIMRELGPGSTIRLSKEPVKTTDFRLSYEVLKPFSVEYNLDILYLVTIPHRPDD